MSLTAAIAQFAPGEDKAANVDTMIGLLTQAAERGAQVTGLDFSASMVADAMTVR